MTRKLRVRRKQQETGDAVTPTYVNRAIQEALDARGFGDFREWQDNINEQLQIIRTIMHDMRDTVMVVSSNDGSVRARMQELLEYLQRTFENVEMLMQPEDDARPSLRLQGQPDGRPEDDQVESDDYDDPIDSMFDDVDAFNTQ